MQGISLTVCKGIVFLNLLDIGYDYKLADFIVSTLYLIFVSSVVVKRTFCI